MRHVTQSPTHTVESPSRPLRPADAHDRVDSIESSERSASTEPFGPVVRANPVDSRASVAPAGSNPRWRSARATVGHWLFLFSLATACALASGCDSGQSKPVIQPVGAQNVAVNQELRISLDVENPDGLALDWSVDEPGLPSFAEVTSLAGTPFGAVFRWTPLASHVGTHELIFEARSDAGTSAASVIITVTPADSAAPIFLRPGFGGTFDLEQNPCVEFDIEVRDDDSTDVEIRAREPLPEGADIIPSNETSKRASFEWCPTEQQTERSLRWNIALEADDGEHEPTPRDYLIVLRTPSRTDCPGTPPTVQIDSPSAGATVNTPGGYVVEITVSDDTGVRDAPILYYTTSEPSDPVDVNEFEQRLFESTGASSFRAIVPPLDLGDGETAPVWFMVEVTDNDDPSGTSCDHRTTTDVRQFTASGSGGALAEDCAACTASSQCASGICAADAGGGTCLPACGGGCAAGTCMDVVNVFGQSTEACGDAATVCRGGGGMCTPDGNEPNDTFAEATPLSDGTQSATICAGDIDFWRIDATSDIELTVAIENFDVAADLDLGLESPDGTIDLSAGTEDIELLTHCLEGGKSVVATVYAYSGEDESPYDISLATSVGNCCTDDAGEPDSTLANARPTMADGSFEGTLCPNDNDHIEFDVDAPQRMTALVIFNSAEIDIDLELYGPDNGFLAGKWTDTTDEETLEWDLPEAGTYTLRIKPFGEGEGDYIGSITLEGLGECTSTTDCPLFNVCSDQNECVSDQCTTDGDCPSSHTCPPAGPGLSYGFCASPCSVNGDCRSEEACKWFHTGVRGCGQTGSGQNGEKCSFFEKCGGQRDCIDWPNGYCARAGCSSNGDCESNTFCANVDGLNVCVRRCGGTEPACRISEGYSCQVMTDVDGGTDEGCVP